MGTNTITSIGTATPVEATGDQLDQYKQALGGDHVPRNTSGVPTDQAGSVGSSSYQWSNIRFKNSLIKDGSIIDISGFEAEPNQIISGVEASDGYPDYLNFATTTLTIDTTTDFVYMANGIQKTLSADVNIASLTVAPAANNTCLINDVTYADGIFTKTEGEHGVFIVIDAAGSEITDLIGTIQPFKHGAGPEIFYAYIESATKIIPFKRGIAKSSREVMTNDDIITLLKSNHCFINADGATTYKTTTYPKYGSAAPSAPATGNWYLNTNTKVWNRYNGATWDALDANYIGDGICDNTAIIGAEHQDFAKSWGSECAVDIVYVSATKTNVRIKKLNVAGTIIQAESNYGQEIDLSTAGDRESGVSEAASTLYYIYVDMDGKPYYSNVCPRPFDSREGMYHPKYYWRCIGTVYNDAGSNIVPFIFGNGNYIYTSNGTGAADVNANTSSFAIVIPIDLVTVQDLLLPPYVSYAFYGLYNVSGGSNHLAVRKRGNTWGDQYSHIPANYQTHESLYFQNSTITGETLGTDSVKIYLRRFEIIY